MGLRKTGGGSGGGGGDGLDDRDPRSLKSSPYTFGDCPRCLSVVRGSTRPAAGCGDGGRPGMDPLIREYIDAVSFGGVATVGTG